jgi:fumarylacetoacetate (FAA) hydrolase
MKLLTYLKEGHEQLGVLINDIVYDMEILHPDLPNSMSMFLNYWDESFPVAQAGELMLKEGSRSSTRGVALKDLQLLAPVPFPTSCRGSYAFRQHVEEICQNNKTPVMAEFDNYPLYHFTNHHSIKGPGEIHCIPDQFDKLDFELEAAVVISRHGRNIKAAYADNYIAGLMIMNGMAVRSMQAASSFFNMGPANGKDFCTVIGPCLVTLDDLEFFEIPAKDNHTGKAWNLKMNCLVNGVTVSEGNLGNMDWTFAEIIERASYGNTLYAGDVIGSGPVGSGCFFELNGSGKRKDPNYTEQWLLVGDTVEMEIDQLGKLSNTVVIEEIERNEE